MCDKAEYLFQGERVVLQYYHNIANLFSDWQIPAPVTLQTLSDAITVGGQDFKEDLYAVTIAPQQEQGGRIMSFEGDPGEKSQFMDFLDVLNDILGGPDTGTAPGESETDPKKPDPDKPDMILGMEASNFILLVCLVILVILIVIVMVR